MKDSASPFRAMTENERNYFMTLILDSYSQFLDAVQSGRNMDEKTLKPLADGRVYTGRMAKELKLVDELGGVEEAIDAAKKLAGLEDKKPKIIYHQGATAFERLMGLLSKEPLAPLSKLENSSTSLEYRLQ
jgi:protease-4